MSEKFLFVGTNYDMKGVNGLVIFVLKTRSPNVSERLGNYSLFTYMKIPKTYEFIRLHLYVLVSQLFARSVTRRTPLADRIKAFPDLVLSRMNRTIKMTILTGTVECCAVVRKRLKIRDNRECVLNLQQLS